MVVEVTEEARLLIIAVEHVHPILYTSPLSTAS